MSIVPKDASRVERSYFVGIFRQGIVSRKTLFATCTYCRTTLRKEPPDPPRRPPSKGRKITYRYEISIATRELRLEGGLECLALGEREC